MRASFLLMGVLLATLQARAQTNLILLNSPAGDYIGQGQFFYSTNPANFNIAFSGPPGVSIYAFGYDTILSGPNLIIPGVGIYSNAVRFPFNGSSPGLSISGNGRACDSLCGNFQIFEMHTDAGGNIDRFWATFSQKCSCGGPPMTGEVRYNSLLAPAAPLPRTLHVPADFPNIQSALSNVNNMTIDTVLVDPGIYYEAVQFGNRRAQLIGAYGPTATYLVASNSTVISFGGVLSDSTVSGFTLMDSGTGIDIANGGSPVIVSNAIVNCVTGINCDSGSSDIEGSPIIRANTITGCPGGAIGLSFTSAPLIENNRLEDNGGGIGMWEAGTPTIRNNVIRRNHGDGIGMVNYSSPDIVQNLILENDGNGVSWTTPENAQGPNLVNNTIVGNGGSGISSGSYGGGVIINNILVGNPAISGNNASALTVQFNDVYSATGPAYSGIPDLTGTGGNISTNPYFVCQPGGDFRLLATSPCIDAGTNVATPLLPTDFGGQTRILAGHTNGSAVVDMGAYELSLLALPPSPCLFVDCPGNVVVIATPGGSSAPANYPLPFATPGATVSNSPPSGSIFPAGTNFVTSTAIYGTNILNCTFTVTVLVPPAITNQPQGQSIAAGHTASFTVAASGSTPLNYQWTFEGLPIYSGTNSSLFIPNPQSTNEGYYRVIVFNAAGSITSSPALLRVLPAGPTILGGPNSLTMSAGSNAAFTVTASGSSPMGFQWFHDGSPVPTATNSQFVIANVQATNAGNYQVVVSNLLGTATSTNAYLNVLAAKPVFTLQPYVPNLLPLGTNYTLQVLAVGTAPISYQWQRYGTNVPDATQSSLTLSNVNSANSGSYRVVATNYVGGTTSQIASVFSIGTIPTLTQQPASKEVLQGSTVTFNSLATGSTPLSYQWYFNGTNLPGATNRQLILVSVSPAAVGGYFVRVTNLYGTAISTTAQLTVNQSIILLQPLTNQVVDAGATITLAVNATGTVSSGYNWSFNGMSVPGTNAFLTLSNIQTAQSGFYGVSITNQYGSLSSTGRVSVFGPLSAVVAWGDNSGNQTNVPTNLNDSVQVCGGDYHSLALHHNGSLIAWGFNADGQTNVPSSLLRFVSIAAGAAHNLAIAEDGSLIAWGRNDSGQCNIPATVNSVIAVAAGDSHSLALLSSGRPVAWGDNSFGQTSVSSGLTGVRAIAAGREHNLALLNNGTVVGWGLNSAGQASAPAGLSGVAGIAAGYLHSVALLSNGVVVVWGDNTYGQTNIPQSATNILAVAAGDFHTLALRADGSIVGWGNNWFGQATVPTLAQNASGIACGYYHSLALSPTPKLQMSSTTNGVVIQWSGPGVLQWSRALTGPYFDIPEAMQSFTNTDFYEQTKFFRVRR